MLETPAEIDGLQQLLDRSAAGGGPHLRGIITDERRLSATQVIERLPGMRLLVVATVTADGRPQRVDGSAVRDQAVGELRYRGQVGQVDPADLELGAGLAGQDLLARLLPLGDRPDRHHHVRPGSGQAPGSLPAGAAVGARDHDELACLIGNRVHGLSSEFSSRPSVCYFPNLSDRRSVHKGPLVCKIRDVVIFQRARSEEQREARRQSILGAAAAMLAEMPVAEVTLNELSQRPGLAKSNVLRYFESREAVLLKLLDSAWQGWLAELAADLAEAVDATAPLAERADQLAAAVAASLASRPMLCDLISAQAAVLERNVSPQVAAQYKRASIAGITALGALVLTYVAELGEHNAVRLAGAVTMMTGALWPHTQPSAAMLAAYAADPALAALRLDFAATVSELLEVMIAGLLARSSR